MSFGGGQNEIKYKISVDATDATTKIPQVSQQISTLGQTTQSSSQQMQSLPQTYKTIVETGNQVTTTTKQVTQGIQGTTTVVTQATQTNRNWGQTLKDSVLGIANVATGIIGLVQQYTSLSKAQNTLQRARDNEGAMLGRLQGLQNKYADAVRKYGSDSREALDIESKITTLQGKHSTALERIKIMQEQVNERTADFAFQILPSIIQLGSGAVDIFAKFSKTGKAVTTTTTEIADGAVNATSAMGELGSSTFDTAVEVESAAATTVSAMGRTKTALNETGVASTRLGNIMRSTWLKVLGPIAIAIGAVVVASKAWKENWLGFGDFLNNIGVAIGNMHPTLKILMEDLAKVGLSVNALIEGRVNDIPKIWAGVSKSFKDTGETAAESGKDMLKLAQDLGELQKAGNDLILSAANAKKGERKDILESWGIKGGARTRFNDVLDNIKDFAKKFQGITDSFKVQNALTAWGKVFDIPESVFKKSSYTIAARFKKFAKEANDTFKYNFYDIANIAKQDAKKGGKQTMEDIAKYLFDHPAFYDELKSLGLIDKETETLVEEKAKEAGEKTKEAMKAGIAQVDPLTDADWAVIMGKPENAFSNYNAVTKMDTVNGKKQPHTWFKMKDPLDTMKENAKKQGVAIATGFKEGLQSVLGGKGSVLGTTVGGIDWLALLGPQDQKVMTKEDVGKWLDSNVVTPVMSAWAIVRPFLVGYLKTTPLFAGADFNVDVLAPRNNPPVLDAAGVGKWLDAFVLTPIQSAWAVFRPYVVGYLKTTPLFAGADFNVDILAPRNNPDVLTPAEVRTWLGTAIGEPLTTAWENFKKTLSTNPVAVGIWNALKGGWQGLMGMLNDIFGEHNASGQPTPTTTPAITNPDKLLSTQTLQKAIQSLTTYGTRNLQALAKAARTNFNTVANYAMGAATNGIQPLQVAIESMTKYGIKNMVAIGKSAKTNFDTVANYINKGALPAVQTLQVAIESLKKYGINNLTALAKASSKQMNGFANNIDEGTKAVQGLQKAINSLKSKSVTVSVKVSGASGGISIERIATGGIISAARGFTTNGPQLLMVGDNPGGRETVAVIPRDNPRPTMQLLDRQVFGESTQGGYITVNLTNVLNDREITRTFRREIGKDIYRFGPR